MEITGRLEERGFFYKNEKRTDKFVDRFLLVCALQ